jgi:RNA polymerase sigma-70 factor (ECF subfamily)
MKRRASAESKRAGTAGCNAGGVSGHSPFVERRVRFELLYAEHAPAVKAYVLRRASARSADDVVAEVFVVCWRRLDELPAEPLPWLLGVARRVLSSWRRSEQRRARLSERLIETSQPAGEPIGELGDRLLARALAQLSDSDRELLLLIAWDGLTPAQAAAALEIRPATARVRLLRARRRLAAALGRQTAATPAKAVSMEMSP